MLSMIAFPTEPDTLCTTLNNSVTTFSRCVGYCQFHHVFLTAKQLKGKKCLSKQCHYLVKTENQFWTNRAIIKKRRQERKEAERKRTERACAILVPPPKTETKADKKRVKHICIDLEMTELSSAERSKHGGLRSEVIQIGAVMLDENLAFVSSFQTLVKPLFSSVTPLVQEMTGISDEMLENAPSFTIAFYHFFAWANGGEITSYCWSVSDYLQLLDELYIKARKHDEYFLFLNTFVDLQASFGTILQAQKSISLDAALNFCCLRFTGKRHSALSDAFNTARILRKIKIQKHYAAEFSPICKNPSVASSSAVIKRASSRITYATHKNRDDSTTSFASFMSPELLEKYAKKTDEPKKDVEKEKKETPSKNTAPKHIIFKHFPCSRYGISVKKWISFSLRMSFIADLKNNNPPDTL